MPSNTNKIKKILIISSYNPAVRKISNWLDGMGWDGEGDDGGVNRITKPESRAVLLLLCTCRTK